jgi:hypothetical protein
MAIEQSMLGAARLRQSADGPYGIARRRLAILLLMSYDGMLTSRPTATRCCWARMASLRIAGGAASRLEALAKTGGRQPGCPAAVEEASLLPWHPAASQWTGSFNPGHSMRRSIGDLSTF